MSFFSLKRFVLSATQSHKYFTRTKLNVIPSRYITKCAKYQQNAVSEKVSNTLSIYSKDEMLHVQTEQNGHQKFPLVWLRDNCQCPSCFNPQMQSRTIDWREFNMNVQPKTVSRENEQVNIEWSDGHKSIYAFEWLKEREFSEESQKQWLQTVYKLPQVAWNSSNFSKILRRFKYDAIIQSDEELFQWLRALATVGIAILEDAPRKEDTVHRLAERVGFIKRTHYGVEFVVRNKPDTTNLAYLAIPLQMHTDMPYYDYKPGINLLHCMEQTAAGGENQFCDAVWMAQWLKENHPRSYALLASTPVEWADMGREDHEPFHTLHRAPVICEDAEGGLARVNYNQWQRDSHFSVPLEQVAPWYEAMMLFTRALYDPRNMVQLRPTPGDVVTFNNTRMLHGRSGYVDGPDAERVIVGAYVDWDVAYSCLRVLQRRRATSGGGRPAAERLSG